MANLSKPPVKPQVFVDANVLIRGATFPRFPYEVLHHAARGDLTLVLSPTVLDEASRCLQELFPSEIWRFQALLDILPIRLAPDPSPAEVAMH